MLEALLTSFGGAAGVAVMAYLAKRILEHNLSGELEQFKIELKAQHDQGLEHLKHELRVGHERDLEKLRSEMRVAAHERETRFSRYHERQVETLTELHRRLVIAERAYLKALSGADLPRGSWFWDALLKAKAVLREYSEYLDEYLIFIPPALADELAFAARLLLDVYHSLEQLRPLFDDLTESAKWEHREAAAERIAELTPLRERLRQRVRHLMGGERTQLDSWAGPSEGGGD